MDINGVQENDMPISDSDMEDQERERTNSKMKNPEPENVHVLQWQPMELALCVRGAVDIDEEPEPGVMGTERIYCALYWIEPDQVYHTRAVRTSNNNPVWEELDFLPVLEYIPGRYGFLNVEIARLCSDTDPGTSSGSVIVGRVRVPLPRSPYGTIEGPFRLVRHVGGGHMGFAGEIILCMKIQRAWPQQQQQPEYIMDDHHDHHRRHYYQ